jgi:septal ring factor EnvC (AmiA/AmiB activator)
MKRLFWGVVAVMFMEALVLAAADQANAGTRTPLANKRMQIQKKRVKRGVKSGQLTQEETKELKADHQALREEIKDAKSDGKVTKKERKEIQKDLNAGSKKIYKLKHNGAKRPKAGGATQQNSQGGSDNGGGQLNPSSGQ